MKLNIQESIKKTTVKKIHRDISWLSFNERVLQEATDKRNPLLERVKFLGIYSKNLGEFFHVRMAYHLNLVRINKSTRKKLDYSPKRLIKQIISIVNVQQVEFSRIINEEIKPELESHNIRIKYLDTITDSQRAYVHEYFNDTLRLHVDPLLMRGKSINPFLKDGSLYLGILLVDKKSKFKNSEYGLVRIPSDVLPRFVELPSSEGGHDIMMLDDILRHGLSILFSGFKILGSYSFKMTRDAELYIEGNYSGSLKEAIRKSLKKRQVGTPARFVYDREMPPSLLSFLTDSFDLNKYDKIKEGRYQNYHDLLKFPDFGRLDLKNKKLDNLRYETIEGADKLFENIRRSDHIIHPPYQSFESAIQFFEFASTDNQVKEILVTQYRIGENSRILNALISAAQHGIKVTVFLEVQARFDEQANLAWGEKLEKAGVDVIYSIPGVKVHCKIGLIKREENGKLEQFSILSTGNFHELNSKIYGDICLFTYNIEICDEVDKVFDLLKHNKQGVQNFSHLLVGKSNLRSSILEKIDKEIALASEGKYAHIIIKVNSLEDDIMIDKLYEASKANVKIDLIVRGICCLVPGIINQSENIRVISILDRYLEHARVYYFHNDGNNELYLSSADWMARNLSRRIEVAFPIYNNLIKQEIIYMLDLQLNDNMKARIISQDQLNEYVTNEGRPIQSQLEIYKYLERKTLVSSGIA